MTHCSSDLSLFMPDQDFVELLWENGQIVMQGPSNRPKKNSGKFQDRDDVIPKIGQSGAEDSPVNSFVPAVPSNPIGLNAQNYDIAPWMMNYPPEESFQNDYCSEFFSEYAGIQLNPNSNHGYTVPADRINEFGQTGRDSHNGEHWPTSKAQAGGSEPTRTRTHQDPHENLDGRSSEKQAVDASKPPPSSNGMDLVNFSHFSRPITWVRPNLQSVDRLRSYEKASTSRSSKPMDSTVIESATGPVSVPPMVGLRPSAQPIPESSGAICWEDTSMAASVALVRHEVEKGPEAAVASSSICSVSSAGAESSEPLNVAKRKSIEVEESEYQSEDVEDEAACLTKQVSGRTMNAKRTRAAEVHNLSERRRRDRINEKMRALQELIPNCNRVDKASMLDEAIEYLKTLKLQVQMMSMGSGLYMPPMMIPAALQHLWQPPMAHLSPMGVTMGMGYGMGMLDMNGSPGCPLVPVPPMHGPQFHCSSMHGMPGSARLPMYGIPGHGHPLSMPRPPGFGSMSGAVAPQLQVADRAPSSSKEHDTLNIKMEINTSAGDSQIRNANRAG